MSVALPKGWSAKRLKYVATYNDDVLPEDTDDLKEIDYVEISGVSLTGGVEEINRMPFFQAPSRARRLVRSGDILISTVRTYLKAIAAIRDASDDLVASTGFCVVRPSEEVDSSYLGWVAKSEPFVSAVVARSVGVSYPAINASELATLRVPLPPIETQQRIARFLDDKAARIDALIAKKRALLERLAEKRQALITRAVTKGLNPDAPMKPSGIDWLGEIPVHWEVRRIKELGILIGGAGFPHEYQGEKDLPLQFFKVADLGLVSQSENLMRAENSIGYETAKELNASIIKLGDIAFAKVGAALLLNRFRKIGTECCIDNNMMAFRPSGRILAEFALFALGRINFADIVNPGAIPSVNGGQVGRIWIALPKLEEEQQEIVEELKRRIVEIEVAENRVQKSVEALIEFRAAIIASAVTGQIAELN